MIHLDSVLFYSLAAFICFMAATIFKSFNEVEKENDIKIRPYKQEPITSDRIKFINEGFNLKPGQFAIGGNWKESAEKLIEIAKEMQKPRTIAVINDQTKTRTAKRIRKGTNSRTKKKNSPARTRNKTVTKRNRLQSKQVKVSS